MEVDPGTMEEWRKCFRSAGKDIFEVVEHAILVAAADSPSEFRLRRDRIAELLYTCHLARQRGVSGGVVGNDDDEEEQEEEEMMKRDFTPGEKERKVDSSDGLRSEVNRTVSNYSYDEAEALTEEMEEESQIVGEVLRIRELLCNHDESDSVLFESLRRLQLMSLSVETLKATEIGRAVNGLRKRNSKQIRHLARTLIDGWKVLVDEWVSATAAIADNSPESVNPSTLDEEDGLPSPPLDEGAFLATQNTNIQLSEFFDGIDDDGNFRNTGDREDHVIDSGRKVGEYGVKQNYDRRHIENHKPMQEHKQKQQQQQPGGWATAEGKVQNKIQEPVVRKQSVALSGQANPHGTTNKQNKLAVADSGPGRPARQSLEQKQIGGAKPRQQDLSGAQRKPPNVLQDKSKYSEEASERAKLEATKRRLHERYQEAENAKKQRTIQVMELQDIPKQAHNHRPPFTKPKGNIRSWANTRR